MNEISIGSMRWPVTVYIRSQVPDAGVGIAETQDEQFITAADIQPVGALTFYTALNADFDKPITHIIIMRWNRGFDLTYLVTRLMGMPDGSSRSENYRVRRYLEIDGRIRFVKLECQLESVTYS